MAATNCFEDFDDDFGWSWTNYFTKQIGENKENIFEVSNSKYRANLTVILSWSLTSGIILYSIIGFVLEMNYSSTTWWFLFLYFLLSSIGTPLILKISNSTHNGV